MIWPFSWIFGKSRKTRRVLVVKVGNDERPAGPADIADAQQQLAAVANDPSLTLITHHAISFEYIELPDTSSVGTISRAPGGLPDAFVMGEGGEDMGIGSDEMGDDTRNALLADAISTDEGRERVVRAMITAGEVRHAPLRGQATNAVIIDDAWAMADEPPEPEGDVWDVV